MNHCTKPEPQASTERPLFVIGIWRSGTSLLYTLLNQHPDIALLYEGDLPEFWPMFLLPWRRSAWLERWNLYNDAVTRHQLDCTAIPDESASITRSTEICYKQYAAARGARVWGCKSPSYYCSLPRLVRDFPDARIIVIWRDLQSTCNAILRAAQTSPWFRRPGIIHRAIFGYRRLKRDSDRLAAAGFSVHHLNYEDLVKNPVTVMGQAFTFLDLDFDPQMVSLAGADTSAIYEGAHHSRVKSERICATTGVDLLSTKTAKKIARYVHLWKEESRGNWPEYPKTHDAANTRKPSFFEKVSDQFSFFLLRSVDRFTILAFCFVPLPLLRGYRRMRAAINPERASGARIARSNI